MPSGTLVLPRLYVILDAGTLVRVGVDLVPTAETLRSAGVTLFQYRDKRKSREALLVEAQRLRDALQGTDCQLILNDEADAAAVLGFDGVHVGQGDLDVLAARSLIGAHRILGVSTHTETQVRAADIGDADYVAIGPVFPTGTKADAEQVVGLNGVRRARELTHKPLVAVGGISASNALSVLDAGADSIAVIGGLFTEHLGVGECARRLLEIVSK